MVMKRIFLAMTAFLMTLGAIVSADAQVITQQKFYVSGDVGTAFLPNRSNSIPFGVAVGDEFNKYLRAELAFDAYTAGNNATTSIGSLTNYTFMTKGYVQYPVTSMKVAFTPYAMAGFGLGLPGGAGATFPTTGVWTVGAGVMFPVTTAFQVGVGYEYIASTSPVVAQPGYTDVFQANVVKLIGRINF
jgi:opacity protein-like surface antigen